MNTNPIAAKNIALYLMYNETDGKYLLGSKDKDRYVILTKEKGEYFLHLLSYMDGSRSAEQLSSKWNLSIETTKNIIEMFYKNGLLADSPENDNTEVKRLSKRLLRINCNHLSRISVRVAQRLIVCFFAVLVLLGVFDLYSLLDNYDSEFNLFKFNDSYLLSLLISSLIMIPSFFVHELCHSIAAVKNGLKPSNIDVCLYLYLFPLFYVKIKGLYTVKYKQRIMIMSAGMLGNVFLGFAGFALYSMFGDGIFLTIVLAQCNIILANLNPFSLSDGYYIISMMFRSENLRKNMFDIIANLDFKKYRQHYKLFSYIVFNLILITINAVYLSKFSYGVICEVLHTNISTWIVPVANIMLIVCYWTIVHFRFKRSKDS